MTSKKPSRKVKPSTVVADDPDNMKGELKAIGGSRDEHGHVGFQGAMIDRKSSGSTFAFAIYYQEWKGKLIVECPQPAIRWWRRADSSQMPVSAVLEESALDEAIPPPNHLQATS